MMRNKKNLKYIAILAATVIVLVLVEVLTPKPINWTVTYSKKDKIPYGTFVLHDLLSSYFQGKNILHSYETIYEQQDIIEDKNIFILASEFGPDKADTEALLQKIDQGAHAFIAANYFFGTFADTLNIEVEDYIYEVNSNYSNRPDTTSLELANPRFGQIDRLQYQTDQFPTYFSSVDTLYSSVILQNENGEVLGIKMPYGKGNLLLCTTPMIFTNNYLLAEKNDQVTSGILSYLPDRDILWTEYYHLGRMESQSPIRFIMKSPALRWAYYIILIGLLLLFIFETKRRQRAIPIIKPYPNTSIEFVNVVSNLYLHSNEHKKIAEKRIAFFMEQIRQRYLFQKISFDDEFYHTLAQKSGNTTPVVKALFEHIENIRSLPTVTVEELQKLSIKIDQFY